MKRSFVSRRFRRFSQMLIVCLNRSSRQIRADIFAAQKTLCAFASFTSLREKAKFYLPQIPQIFADVCCVLKLKFKADPRRYFCCAKIRCVLEKKSLCTLCFVVLFVLPRLHLEIANFSPADFRRCWLCT
jgi:hypothetical protein